MNKIILASGNLGKTKEIQQVLADQAIKIISQSECNIFSPPETGLTFVENALLKARYAADITKLPAIGDDSGLVVPILQGQPGIYSARFAGENATDAENINKLLTLMQEIPKEKRQAYFYCVMVLLRDAVDPEPLIAIGKWQGEILFQPQGTKGFGYDPIFYVPTHHCSAAELTMTEKNKISHRGQALQQLRKFFRP